MHRCASIHWSPMRPGEVAACHKYRTLIHYRTASEGTRERGWIKNERSPSNVESFSSYITFIFDIIRCCHCKCVFMRFLRKPLRYSFPIIKILFLPTFFESTRTLKMWRSGLCLFFFDVWCFSNLILERPAVPWAAIPERSRDRLWLASVLARRLSEWPA